MTTDAHMFIQLLSTPIQHVQLDNTNYVNLDLRKAPDQSKPQEVS